MHRQQMPQDASGITSCCEIGFKEMESSGRVSGCQQPELHVIYDMKSKHRLLRAVAQENCSAALPVTGEEEEGQEGGKRLGEWDASTQGCHTQSPILLPWCKPGCLRSHLVARAPNLVVSSE